VKQASQKRFLASRIQQFYIAPSGHSNCTLCPTKSCHTEITKLIPTQYAHKNIIEWGLTLYVQCTRGLEFGPARDRHVIGICLSKNFNPLHRNIGILECYRLLIQIHRITHLVLYFETHTNEIITVVLGLTTVLQLKCSQANMLIRVEIPKGSTKVQLLENAIPASFQSLAWDFCTWQDQEHFTESVKPPYPPELNSAWHHSHLITFDLMKLLTCKWNMRQHHNKKIIEGNEADNWQRNFDDDDKKMKPISIAISIENPQLETATL